MSTLKTSYYLCVICLVILYSTTLLAKIITTCNLTVTKVLNGDTFLANNNRSTYRIRLLGINAPLLATKPVWAFANTSKDFLNTLINQQQVCVVVDSTNRLDKYRQILAQVYKQNNNLWVNGTMVQQGLAYVYIISPKINQLNKLIALENIAITHNLNIWGNQNYKIIKINEVHNYIGQYKIITGTITNIKTTKKSIWLEFSSNQLTTFSVRVPKIQQFTAINWQALLHKSVKVRGYIQQYTVKFNPFITLVNLQTIELIK